jgi:uncharacterized protein
MRPRFVISTFLALSIGFCAGLVSADAGAEGAQEASLFVMMYTPGAGWDASQPPQAQRHFDTHSANLSRLRRDSVTVAGGRFGQWGLILVRAADETAAQALFAPDSSLAAGTFQGEVHSWTTIYDGAVTRR